MFCILLWHQHLYHRKCTPNLHINKQRRFGDQFNCLPQNRCVVYHADLFFLSFFLPPVDGRARWWPQVEAKGWTKGRRVSGVKEDAYLLGTKHACRQCKQNRMALEVSLLFFWPKT